MIDRRLPGRPPLWGQEPTYAARFPDITKRLKQAQGHVASIPAMVLEERPCASIVQQLQAIGSTINADKRALIHDQIKHYVGDVLADGGESSECALRAFSLAREPTLGIGT